MMDTKLTFPVYMLLGDLAVMEYHPIHFMLVDENDESMKVRIDVPAKYIANAEQIIQDQISANKVSNVVLSLEGLQFCYNSITQAMKPPKTNNDNDFDEDFN